MSLTVHDLACLQQGRHAVEAREAGQFGRHVAVRRVVVWRDGCREVAYAGGVTHLVSIAVLSCLSSSSSCSSRVQFSPMHATASVLLYLVP